MGSEWPIGRLGDYVDACLGKMLDKEKNRGEYSPYLGNKNVRWGTFDLNDLAEMRFEEHENDRYGLQSGDLIICEGGEPGRCAIWTEEVPNMKIQKALHRVRPREGLNNYYLHYWFTWAGQNGLLDAYFTGTTIKHLTGKALASLEVPIPPMKSQEGMVKILKSLDDKIALNRQINTTLESMAQALFKSWFVDFDPVIDNALAAGNEIPDALQKRAAARAARREALRQQTNETTNKTTGATDADSPEQALPDTGLSDQRLPSEIQQLFPDRFVFTEDMGWVPEGWEVTKLGNEIDFATGPAFKSAEFSGSGIRLARGDNVKEGCFYWGDKTRYWPEVTENLEPYLLKDGDVLIGMDGSKVGKNWTRVRDNDLPCLLVQRVARLRPSFHVGSNFLEILIGSSIFKNYVELVKTGTSIPHISGGQIKNFPIIRPNDDGVIYGKFEKLLSPSAMLRSNNYSSIQILSSVRDSLLPKLLSGQITIPDAEQQLAEVL